MSQTRSRSLFESLANVAVGYGVAVWAQTIIFPWFGVHLATRDHLWMGGFFTVVSIARSYALRRFFNWLDMFFATYRSFFAWMWRIITGRREKTARPL